MNWLIKLGRLLFAYYFLKHGNVIYMTISRHALSKLYVFFKKTNNQHAFFRIFKQ